MDQSLEKTREVCIQKPKFKAFSEVTQEEIVRKLAYGAVKFADLSISRTKTYKFSFDRMLNLKGNTAPFILYAYTRICSIIGKSRDYFPKISDELGDLCLSEPSEMKLAKLLLCLPDVIQKVEKDFMFYVLADYLYRIADTFHSFHIRCRCIEYNENGEIVKTCGEID